MNFRNFQISPERKKRITEKLRHLILEQEQVLFAFIFGSFHDSSGNLPFQDIDKETFLKDQNQLDIDS
jgi:hypothetical protein